LAVNLTVAAFWISVVLAVFFLGLDLLFLSANIVSWETTAFAALWVTFAWFHGRRLAE
jgi:hypothetical protein